MRSRAALLLLLALAACEPSSRVSPGVPGRTGDAALPNSPIARLFPIIQGNLWHYDTVSDDGERGRIVVRAGRSDATFGELVTPRGVRRFEFQPDGVVLVGLGVYVLMAPIAVGMSFRGEHGGRTRIASVGETIVVPAGTFAGCVVTVEDVVADPPVRYTTTFCPDVGIVALDVQAGDAHERAELRSYGPPVNLGPEGTTFTPPS